MDTLTKRPYCHALRQLAPAGGHCRRRTEHRAVGPPLRGGEKFSAKASLFLHTKSSIVPHGLDWFHEVKYDGNTLRLERDGRCSHVPLREPANDHRAYLCPCAENHGA